MEPTVVSGAFAGISMVSVAAMSITSPVAQTFACMRVKLNLHACSTIHLQRRDERLLRDVDFPELAHLFLAFLLLLQKLALSRDIAAVALCGDVLAQRAHGFTSDDLAADRGLDRDHEHV